MPFHEQLGADLAACVETMLRAASLFLVDALIGGKRTHFDITVTKPEERKKLENTQIEAV